MCETELNYPHITKSIIYELGIETTKKINARQIELKNIRWRNGEANLDTEYSELGCECCALAWNNEMIRKYPEYSEIKIICEIPDINITFIYPDGKIINDKIELKSSTKKTTKGSTIGDLDINQTLIYCLRPSKYSDPYIVRCSQYYNAMGKSDIELFQDRTPRPPINFEKMSDEDNIIPFIAKEKNDWLDHYAKCALKRIEETTKCQESWQDHMIRILKKEIINDYIRNTTEQQFQKDKISLQLLNTNI
uniref:Uncharacterized protein n=1 Tax=Nucleocytoviricota sp. TaxID=2809609 RepID=A0A9E8G555_9VIRU|nr:hypothetical protein [Nucleocytoviricota sp.]UZT29242.1 hypothetical protein [Nucleocytoviricota sp.]